MEWHDKLPVLSGHQSSEGSVVGSGCSARSCLMNQVTQQTWCCWEVSVKGRDALWSVWRAPGVGPRKTSMFSPRSCHLQKSPVSVENKSCVLLVFGWNHPSRAGSQPVSHQAGKDEQASLMRQKRWTTWDQAGATSAGMSQVAHTPVAPGCLVPAPVWGMLRDQLSARHHGGK